VAAELTLTAPAFDFTLPAPCFFIRFPSDDSLGLVRLITVEAVPDSDSVVAFVDGAGLSECVSDPPAAERYASAVRSFVANLCTALTCRQDDLIAETLEVKQRKGEVRPRITRVRMKTPRIDLAPHVQRFLLEGKRAFHGKRGHHVMGFFRRAPKGEEKTVWVRPHFRGGGLGDEAVTPNVTRVIDSRGDEV
jgi:hypothetical protein